MFLSIRGSFEVPLNRISAAEGSGHDGLDDGVCGLSVAGREVSCHEFTSSVNPFWRDRRMRFSFCRAWIISKRRC